MEIVVKIYPIMPVRVGALVRFANVRTAAQAVIKIVQTGPKALCRCELLNADGVKATNKMYQPTTVIARCTDLGLAATPEIDACDLTGILPT